MNSPDRRVSKEVITFPDRREKMAGHCPNHDEVNRRISDVEKSEAVSSERTKSQEGQIDELFKKYNSVVASNIETLQRLTRIEENQKTLIEKIDKFCEDIGKVCIEDRLNKLEEFDWFRDGMNSIRNKLPWMIMGVFALLVIALVLLHEGVVTLFFKLLGWSDRIPK